MTVIVASLSPIRPRVQELLGVVLLVAMIALGAAMIIGGDALARRRNLRLLQRHSHDSREDQGP